MHEAQYQCGRAGRGRGLFYLLLLPNESGGNKGGWQCTEEARKGLWKKERK